MTPCTLEAFCTDWRLMDPETFAAASGVDLDERTKAVVVYPGDFSIEWFGGDSYRMDLYGEECYTGAHEPYVTRRYMETQLFAEWQAAGAPAGVTSQLRSEEPRRLEETPSWTGPGGYCPDESCAGSPKTPPPSRDAGSTNAASRDTFEARDGHRSDT